MTPQKKIWIILDHPWQLMLALSIRSASPDNFKYGLIISRHKYWSHIDIEKYRGFFEQIFFFEEPIHVHSFRQMLQFLRQCKHLRQAVRKIPIGKSDVLVTISYAKYLENILTTEFISNKQIFLCRYDMYKELATSLQTIVKSPDYRLTKSSLIHHYILEPLLRLRKRTYFFWVKGEQQSSGVAFSRKLEDLYDKVFLIKPVFAGPLEPNDIYFPYLLLRKTDGKNAKKRIVYFLSGQVPSGYAIAESYYIKVNAILNTLRNRYAGRFMLEIRLHPNYPDEYKMVDLDGWEINREEGNAEEYLIRHDSEIALAFSHISITLLFSANIGIPSYIYYRCMEFSRAYAAIYERIFADMPKEFFMNSIEQEPLPYPLPISAEDVRHSLQKIYKEFQS